MFWIGFASGAVTTVVAIAVVAIVKMMKAGINVG